MLNLIFKIQNPSAPGYAWEFAFASRTFRGWHVSKYSRWWRFPGVEAHRAFWWAS